MQHFVCKNTTEYRVDTIEEVVSFRNELQQQAVSDGYFLSSFGYSEKLVKAQGEIIDSYYVVKATFTINDAKEPLIPIFDVNMPYAATKLNSSTGNESEVEFD
jgi:hypothetical protein